MTGGTSNLGPLRDGVFEELAAEIGPDRGTLVIVVYTMFGGLKAVAATDVLQMAFIMVGVVVLFFMVVNDAGGERIYIVDQANHAIRLLDPTGTVSTINCSDAGASGNALFHAAMRCSR